MVTVDIHVSHLSAASHLTNMNAQRKIYLDKRFFLLLKDIACIDWPQLSENPTL